MAFDSTRSGLSALTEQLPVEETIEREDALAFDDDEEEIIAPEPTDIGRLEDWIENTNIARDIDQAELDKLGALCVDEYQIDEQSRAEWKEEAKKALDFATQKTEPKQYPWPDASNIVFPLITSAALRFGALAYPALVPNRNVVKGSIWGDDKGTPVTIDGSPDGAPKLNDAGEPIWLIPPGAKARIANKTGTHMSYQLLEQMEYWEEQTDTMLGQLPIVGGAVRKTYRDTAEDCNASELVSLMDIVWNMSAPSFEKAPRHTEIMRLYPHEIAELERADHTFLPLNYGPGDAAAASITSENGTGVPATDPSDTSAQQTFIEQHRRYDLDGDGYEEPLTVTVHLRSASVVRITARYDEDGIVAKGNKLKKICAYSCYTLYRFLPNPKGGSYPCGFGHYLKPINEGINTTINQMFDAGHLQIAGGGFIGTGLSVHAGNTNFSIGEYKPVHSKGMSIRDSIFPIPWPGPSEVLFQLLGFLVSSGKEIASIQDVLTGDASMANTPPTTMLALVDQGMRVYTAIYKRVYRALKAELKKLWRLNRLYIEEDERYKDGDTWRTVTADDYRLGYGVEPAADPTMVTDMQRITRAAMIVDRAKENPMVNRLEAERYLFEAAQIPNINRFLPEKPPQEQPSPEQITAQANAMKAQTDASRAQIEQFEAQSRLGLTRAQELQAYTQAMVNFQKARATMSEPDIAWMENHLTALRLKIEALNTTVKAADVDAKMHGHNLTHKARMAATAAKAGEVADDAGRKDIGGGGGTAADIRQSLGGGPEGGGLESVAAPSGDQGLPGLPGA